MKVTLRRCRICLWWYSPIAHGHCPACGAFPFDGKHYRMREPEHKIIEMVSSNTMPLALRNNYLSSGKPSRAHRHYNTR